MTCQQELELLAEWLGIEYELGSGGHLCVPAGARMQREWNPSPEGNDTDFLHMVAAKQISIVWLSGCVSANFSFTAYFRDHNNDKLAAMKHAAYQVCLMAAREWKGLCTT